MGGGGRVGRASITEMGTKVECQQGVYIAKLSTQGTNRSPHSLRPFPPKPLRYLCAAGAAAGATISRCAHSLTLHTRFRLQTLPTISPLSLPVISHSSWRWPTRLVPASLAATLIMPILACIGKPHTPPFPFPPVRQPSQHQPNEKNPRRHIPVGLASLCVFSYLYVP